MDKRSMLDLLIWDATTNIEEETGSREPQWEIRVEVLRERIALLMKVMDTLSLDKD